jgi:type VI protein secretion system component Hcp
MISKNRTVTITVATTILAGLALATSAASAQSFPLVRVPAVPALGRPLPSGPPRIRIFLDHPGRSMVLAALTLSVGAKREPSVPGSSLRDVQSGPLSLESLRIERSLDARTPALLLALGSGFTWKSGRVVIDERDGGAPVATASLSFVQVRELKHEIGPQGEKEIVTLGFASLAWAGVQIGDVAPAYSGIRVKLITEQVPPVKPTELEASSFQVVATVPTTAPVAGSGKMTFQALELHRRLDGKTPALWNALTTGTVFSSAKIDVVRSGAVVATALLTTVIASAVRHEIGPTARKEVLALEFGALKWMKDGAQGGWNRVENKPTR